MRKITFITFIFTLFFASCQQDADVNDGMTKSKATLSDKISDQTPDSQITMTPTPSNSLNFTIQEGAYQISFDTSVDNTGSGSAMTVSKDDEEIFVTGMMIP